MANKRIQKKRQKQREVEKIRSYKQQYKKPEKLTQSERTQIITRETKKEKHRESQARYRQKQRYQESMKRMELERVTGIPMDEWGRGTLTKLKGYSLEDIRSKKFTVDNFPELYALGSIDFNEEIKIPGGKKISFAFRSLSGEVDISDALHHYNSYTIQDLINNLRDLKNKPRTGSRNIKGKKGRNIGSGGKAGEAQAKMLSPGSFQELYAKHYNADRRGHAWSKKLSKNAKARGIDYQHSGIDYRWQYISQAPEPGDKPGRYKAYSKISRRKLLVIGNAIMDNIKEDDREGFYNDYKDICIQCIPDMERILP